MRRSFTFWIWIALIVPSHAQDVPKTCNGYLLYNVHNARENAAKQIVAGVEINDCDLNLLPDNTINQIIEICGKPGMISTKQITNPKSKCKITAWFTQDEGNPMYHLTTVVQVCAKGRCYQLPNAKVQEEHHRAGDWEFGYYEGEGGKLSPSGSTKELSGKGAPLILEGCLADGSVLTFAIDVEEGEILGGNQNYRLGWIFVQGEETGTPIIHGWRPRRLVFHVDPRRPEADPPRGDAERLPEQRREVFQMSHIQQQRDEGGRRIPLSGATLTTVKGNIEFITSPTPTRPPIPMISFSAPRIVRAKLFGKLSGRDVRSRTDACRLNWMSISTPKSELECCPVCRGLK